MNATDNSAELTATLAVLPPYAPDPRRPSARRRRLIATICVGLAFLVWGVAFALFAPFLILLFLSPIPILAALVVWALPVARRPPLGALAVLLFVSAVCLVMWPNYIAIAPPGFPWITMQRLVGVPLVFILLVCASTSREFQTTVGGALRASPLLSGFFIAFNLLELLSVAYSISPVSSFNAFVNSEIGLTATFFAAVQVFSKPGRAERMARLLWFMSILVGLIAVVEVREGHVPWAGHLPNFLHIDDPVVERALRGVSRFGVYRAEATFGNALGLAEYGALIVPFVINFLIGPYGALTRWAAALSLPFLLFVVFLTGARLGLVGCFISIVLTGVAWGGPKWAKDRNAVVAPIVFLGTVGFMAASIASVYLVGFVHSKVLGGAASESTYARNMQTQMAIPKLFTHPQGHGIGMGAAALGFTTPSGFLTIDSYYLSILMEYGFVGFILFYGIFVLGIWRSGEVLIAHRGDDREIELLKPIGISVVTFLIVKSVFSEQYNHPIMCLLLGIVVALAYRVSLENNARRAGQAALSAVAVRRPAASPPGGPGRRGEILNGLR
jgi:hypothetical protein